MKIQELTQPHTPAAIVLSETLLTVQPQDPVDRDEQQQQIDALAAKAIALAPKLQDRQNRQTAWDAESKAFSTWFKKSVKDILELRQVFDPKPGYSKKIEVNFENGTTDVLSWTEFVQKHMGITIQWMNKLLSPYIRSPKQHEENGDEKIAMTKAELDQIIQVKYEEGIK